MSAVGRTWVLKRLLCSVHDVAPRFESRIDRLVDVLTQAQGSSQLAMLVVPYHWGEDPLVSGSAFAARLRGWADAGTEMFVHGWFHRDDMTQHRAAASLQSRMMTAGEGEFLGLQHGEACRRMRDGQSLIEDIIGRPAAGFIAPAWLYSAEARNALDTCGFALAEDHLRVWQPASGKVVARGPVITWASRSPMRAWSSLAVAAAARRLKRLQRVIRVAVHPGDTGNAAIMRSIDATVRTISQTHRPDRYASLLG